MTRVAVASWEEMADEGFVPSVKNTGGLGGGLAACCFGYCSSVVNPNNNHSSNSHHPKHAFLISQFHQLLTWNELIWVWQKKQNKPGVSLVPPIP